MRIFAYCTESARRAVRAATGTEPLTSPPARAANFNPAWLEGHDLLYFRLHGKVGRRGWYNDDGVIALAPVHVGLARLGGAVVVVANCYGAQSPLVRAFYDAGARAVIGGGGENLAAAQKVVGTDLLVQWVIRMMRLGANVRRALKVARLRLWLTGWRASDRDAARFSLLGGDGNYEEVT